MALPRGSSLPTIGGMDVLFECEREELKEKFPEFYNIISKQKLKNYYLKLVSK